MQYSLNAKDNEFGLLIDIEDKFWELDDDEKLKHLEKFHALLYWKKDVKLIEKYFRDYQNLYSKKRFVKDYLSCDENDETYSAFMDYEINPFLSEDDKKVCEKEYDFILDEIWLLSNPRSPSKTLRKEVIERDGNKCVYCGKELQDSEINIDHVHPYSKKGETSFDNLVVSCVSCNSRKRDKLPGDFLRSIRINN